MYRKGTHEQTALIPNKIFFLLSARYTFDQTQNRYHYLQIHHHFDESYAWRWRKFTSENWHKADVGEHNCSNRGDPICKVEVLEKDCKVDPAKKPVRHENSEDSYERLFVKGNKEVGVSKRRNFSIFRLFIFL